MNPRRQLSIAMFTFASLGLPMAALGVAWPGIATEFGRPLGDLGTIIGLYSIGFFAISLVAGRLVERVGVGPMVVTAAWVATVCLTMYASATGWLMLLPAALVLGISGGAFDAGLNAYTALELDGRAMNLLHAGFGVGATVGPWLMTATLSAGWRPGMWAVTGVGAVVALLLTATRRSWAIGGHHDDIAGPVRASTWVVTTSLALFFFYTGVEVVAGHYAFTFLTEGRGVGVGLAGLAAGGFWFGITASRVALGVAPHRFLARNVLTGASVVATASFLLVWLWPSPWPALLGLVMAGIALGPIFPLNTALTPYRVGRRSATRMIGYQIAAANLGAAALPALTGRAVDRIGLDVVGVVLVLGAAVMLATDRLLQRAKPGDR